MANDDFAKSGTSIAVHKIMNANTTEKQSDQCIRNPVNVVTGFGTCNWSADLVEILSAVFAFFRHGEDLFTAHRAAFGFFRYDYRERLSA